MIELPECNSVNTCPKCRAITSDYAQTVYHERPQLTTDLGSPLPCTWLVYESRFGDKDWEGIGEHLCKVCRRCGFGWMEQVASEDSVYEPRSLEGGET